MASFADLIQKLQEAHDFEIQVWQKLYEDQSSAHRPLSANGHNDSCERQDGVDNESMRNSHHLSTASSLPSAASNQAPASTSVSPCNDPDVKIGSVKAKLRNTLFPVGKEVQKHVNEALLHENETMTRYIVSAGLLPTDVLGGGHSSHTITRVQDTRPLLERCVNHPAFDIACGVLIVMQAVILGIKADLAAKSSSDEDPFKVVEVLLCVCFTIELVFRFSAVGLQRFVFGDDNLWNLFDVVIVSVNISEIILAIGGQDSKSLGALRIIRVMRIMRTIRVIRLIRVFKGLRMMLLSILRSGMLLLWTMLLLGIIIYTFAIYFMQSVTDAFDDNDLTPGSKETMILSKHFGALHNAAYALFLSMSGGIDWDDVAAALGSIHWTNKVVFCFFIFFTVFAMLNIITGIFVDTAVNSARTDKQEVIHEEMSLQNANVKKLLNIFKLADQDGNGLLTLQELEEIMERAEVRAIFSSMGMDVHEARSLFDLLDTNFDGRLSATQFIVGCIRVKGGAKGVDLLTLMHENKKMYRVWGEFFAFVEAEFKKVNSAEATLQKKFVECIHKLHALECTISHKRHADIDELALRTVPQKKKGMSI